jgi:hypothetical protein
MAEPTLTRDPTTCPATPRLSRRSPAIGGRRWRRSAIPIGVAVAVGMVAPGPAAARPMDVTGLRPISGKTPFPDGCGVRGERQPNSEAEPSVAVDPRDPQKLIAAWQQDRFVAAGGALSDLVAVSEDRGRHWQKRKIPAASVCTGGSDERTSDPWVSIGRDGRAYVGILTFDVFPGLEDFGTPTQQRVSRSHKGGRSFNPPAVIADDETYNDRGAVTADPARRGHAYHAWVKRSGTFGESGVAMFSRTTDGGDTWTPQREIHAPRPGTLPDPTLIEVLPDGTLLYFFLLANGSPVIGAPELIPFDVMVMRSTDLGDTWSEPQMIGTIPHPVAPEDPETGAEVRAFPVIDTAIAKDGTAYVVWNEIFSEHSSEIFFSRSRDGGRSWSAPGTVASVPTQAFIPGVAVAREGVVGVSWDDFTGDVPGDDKLTTRVWFAHSHNGGRTWDRRRLGGPFDMLTTPRTSSTGVAGRFVGDYQGLAASGRGFVAVFAQGKTIGRRQHTARPVRGPSDILFARIKPNRKKRR